MARLSKVEACMFCEELPCVCNKPAPKAKATPQPKPDKPFPKAQVNPAYVPEPSVAREKFSRDAPPPVREATDEEFEIMEAIRNLEPLLSDAEKIKWKFVLKPERSAELDRRLTEWRKRNVMAKENPRTA